MMGTTERLIRLAWPLFVAQLAVAGMAVTDTIMAARAGTNELAIVAVGANLLLLGVMFVYGVLLIVSPEAARWSIRRPQALSRLLSHAIALGVGAGSIAALLLWLITGALASHLGPELDGGVRSFMQLGLAAPILAGVYFALRLFWEGLGHTAWTAWISLALFGFNIPLDWFFVLHLDMGAAGCALATSLSFLIGTGLAVWRYRTHHHLRQVLSGVGGSRWSRPLLLALAKVGFPASLALLAEVSLFMLLAVLIAPFGQVALAGHQIAINITSVLYVLPVSLSLALSIEMGRLRGAGLAHQQQGLIRHGLMLAIFLGGGLSLLTLALREPLPRLFTEAADVVAVASVLLGYAAAYQLMDAVQMAAAGLLRGMGQTRWIMWVTLACYWVIGLGGGVWLAWHAGMGVEGFWAGILVALTCAAVLLAARLMTSRHHLT